MWKVDNFKYELALDEQSNNIDQAHMYLTSI